MKLAAMFALAIALAVAPSALGKSDDKNAVEKTAETVGKGAKKAGTETGKTVVKGVKAAPDATEDGLKTAGKATQKGAEATGEAVTDGAKVAGKKTVKGVKKLGGLIDGDKPSRKKD